MVAAVSKHQMFPVQEGGRAPEWLVREAFAEYERIHGDDQSFERLHERGGFGVTEILDLLAGGTGDGRILKRMRESRERASYDARRAAMLMAMRFAGEATADPAKQEAMALLILKAAAAMCKEGFRPQEIERATRALTKADTP